MKRVTKINKGFTLVEIVGVIVILGLIALLAFPPLLNMIKNSENKISEANKSLIYSSSSQYITKYINEFPKENNRIYCITIEKLIKEDLLSSTIDLGDFNLQSYVQIKVNNAKYEYNLVNQCTEN